MTEGDEFGVYRATHEKQRYLLLAFDNRKDAIKFGKAVAKCIRRKLVNHFPAEMLSSGIVSQQDVKKAPISKPKPRNVKGVSKLCEKLLYANTPIHEILEIVSAKYLDAGRNEIYAREAAAWALREVKKKIS